MRLIGTVFDAKQAQQFCQFLTSKHIANHSELVINGDWGSEQYGDKKIHIWVEDEDHYAEAMDYLETFFKDPEAVAFVPEVPKKTIVDRSSYPREPSHLLTLYFLITCILIFATTVLTTPQREHVALPYPAVALYSSEVTQGLLFDFPKAYDLIAEAVRTYGIQKLKHPELLPVTGQQLLQEYATTPYWHGYYDSVVRFLQGKPAEAWETEAQWFEKIRSGEVWRLFSPCLLHSDIFHLLFNMIWLFVIGKQMEQRVGMWRYLLFILASGVIANSAQYLMSGPNFIGFSGILTAMFGFVFVRQRIAGWEGYQLNRSTTVLLVVFISAMFLIQVASFFSEVYAGSTVMPSIANTAHLVGVLVGVILGRLNFFAWKTA